MTKIWTQFEGEITRIWTIWFWGDAISSWYSAGGELRSSDLGDCRSCGCIWSQVQEWQKYCCFVEMNYNNFHGSCFVYLGQQKCTMFSAQYTTVQYSVQYTKVQCIVHCTVKYSTVKYSAEYSAVHSVHYSWLQRMFSHLPAASVTFFLSTAKHCIALYILTI